MDRRDAVRVLASAAGLSMLDGLRPADVLGLGRSIHGRADHPVVLRPHQRTTLEVAAERILPADDSPGAREAGVAPFIEQLLAGWFDAAERERIAAGLDDLDVRARTRGGGAFVELGESEQIAILAQLDGEVADLRRSDDAAANNHPFAMLKHMTVWGYCTSEAGMRALGLFPLPMRYDGCAVLPAGAGGSGAA